MSKRFKRKKKKTRKNPPRKRNRRMGSAYIGGWDWLIAHAQGQRRP